MMIQAKIDSGDFFSMAHLNNLVQVNKVLAMTRIVTTMCSNYGAR